MGEMILFGDPEAAVKDILKNHTTELTAYSPTIRLDLIGYQMGARWIHISMEGGVLGWPKIYRPRIDIECYGDNDTNAFWMAQLAYASLYRAMGSYSGNGVHLTDVKTEIGPTKVPDKSTESPRYIMSLRLTTTPIQGYVPPGPL